MLEMVVGMAFYLLLFIGGSIAVDLIVFRSLFFLAKRRVQENQRHPDLNAAELDAFRQFFAQMNAGTNPPPVITHAVQ